MAGRIRTYALYSTLNYGHYDFAFILWPFFMRHVRGLYTLGSRLTLPRSCRQGLLVSFAKSGACNLRVSAWISVTWTCGISEAFVVICFLLKYFAEWHMWDLFKIKRFFKVICTAHKVNARLMFSNKFMLQTFHDCFLHQHLTNEFCWRIGIKQNSIKMSNIHSAYIPNLFFMRLISQIN